MGKVLLFKRPEPRVDVEPVEPVESVDEGEVAKLVVQDLRRSFSSAEVRAIKQALDEQDGE